MAEACSSATGVSRREPVEQIGPEPTAEEGGLRRVPGTWQPTALGVGGDGGESAGRDR